MDHDIYIDYCGLGSPCGENWHLNQDIEIQRVYYIFSGTGWYSSGGGMRQCFQKGHLYLFPYNLKHRFFTDPADPIRHLFFDFLSAPPIIAQEPLALHVHPDSQLRIALDLAQSILGTHPRTSIAKSPISRHLLQLILDLANEQIPIPYQTDPAICQALKVIQTEYSKAITVRDLAQQAGFEENHFIRRFRNIMKQTPYAYLKNYRLIQARTLLTEGISAAEVALRVGYTSSASLLRALHRFEAHKNT